MEYEYDGTFYKAFASLLSRREDMVIGKSVFGSNIHDIEMWFFHSLWIVFLETLRRFDLSSRSLGHVMMFSFAGTAQEAGSTTSSCFLSSSRERKHHVTKASRREVETSWSFKKHDPKWVKKSHFKDMITFWDYNKSQDEGVVALLFRKMMR